MSPTQAFFDSVGEKGLPTNIEKTQPWKNFFAGPDPSLADSGKLMVDIPSTPATGTICFPPISTVWLCFHYAYSCYT